MTPVEVLLSLHLQHHAENVSGSAAPLSPSPSRRSAVPFVSLIVHRTLPRSSLSPAGDGSVEVEALTLTPQGRDVWVTPEPLLPSLEEAFALARDGGEEGPSKTEDGGIVHIRNDGDVEAKRPAASGASPKAVPLRRRVREHKDFFSIAQKNKEETLPMVGVMPLRRPVDVDGRLYRVLPVEFFHRYLPVVAAEEEPREKEDDAPTQDEGWTEEVFYFSHHGEGEPERSFHFQRRGRHGDSGRQPRAPPSVSQLKDLLDGGLSSGDLLEHLRRFELLTHVAELLRNNEQDLRLICEVLRSRKPREDQRADLGKEKRFSAPDQVLPSRVLRLIRALAAAQRSTHAG